MYSQGTSWSRISSMVPSAPAATARSINRSGRGRRLRHAPFCCRVMMGIPAVVFRLTRKNGALRPSSRDAAKVPQLRSANCLGVPPSCCRCIGNSEHHRDDWIVSVGRHRQMFIRAQSLVGGKGLDVGHDRSDGVSPKVPVGRSNYLPARCLMVADWVTAAGRSGAASHGCYINSHPADTKELLRRRR